MPSNECGHRSSLGPVFFGLILLAAYAIAYPGVFIGSETFFCRDYGSYSYPVAEYAKHSILHGTIPLWNPYSLNGIPFTAQWSPMVFYPATLIYLLIPTWYALPLFMFLHLVMGGVGMRQLLLNLTKSEKAASLAGFSFAFSGLPISLLCWPAHCAAYGWAPWVVLATLWAMELKCRKRLVIAALITTMQLLTGSPEVIAVTWTITAALTIAKHGRPTWKQLLASWTFSLCLAAIQLLPFLGLLLNSNRLDEASLDWSLRPESLLNFIAPLFHTEATPYGFAFPAAQKWLLSYYVPTGLLAMLFIAPKRVWTQRVFIASMLLLGFGLLLSMSPSLPLITKLLALTPVGIVRYPIKYLLLAYIALHIAIGLGIAAAEKEPIPPRHLLSIFAAGILVLGFLILDGQNAAARNFQVRFLIGLTVCGLLLKTWRNSRPALTFALLVLILTDVESHTQFFPTIPRAEFLKERFVAALNRVGAEKPELGKSRLQRMEVTRIQMPPEADHLARMTLLSRNRNLLEEVPSAGGFYSMYLKDQAKLSGKLYAFENCTNNSAPSYFDFIGVSVEQGENGRLRDRKGAMPLLTVGQVPVFAATNEIETALATDLRTHVILPKTAASIFPDSGATIVSSSVTPHRIDAEILTHTNTVLVIAESYYPAWKASVNGRPVALLRANGAFQAVPLVAGKSNVLMLYQDEKLHAGAIISASAACLAIFLLIWPRKTASDPIPPSDSTQPSDRQAYNCYAQQLPHCAGAAASALSAFRKI